MIEAGKGIDALRHLTATGDIPERELLTEDLDRQAFFFEGEPWKGSPTKVFAYLGRPAEARPARGAVVLVHGGGGRAYAEWVTMWTQRGYIALAVDLGGGGLDCGPHEFAGPAPDDAGKFGSIELGVANTWMFHSVAAVLRAVTIALAEPDVDPGRVFLMGISWGAHVAQLVASIDTRLSRAAFIYGAGFLGPTSPVAGALAHLDPELAGLWLRSFDPVGFVPRIEIPTLWITGAEDDCYPLDTFVATARLASGPTVLRTTPGLEHSHVGGWSVIEPYEFFGEQTGSPPLAWLGEIELLDGHLTASLDLESPVVAGQLHFTGDTGPWHQRVWQTLPARVDGRVVRAPAPPGSVTVMLSVTDLRGAVTSVPYVHLTDGVVSSATSP